MKIHIIWIINYKCSVQRVALFLWYWIQSVFDSQFRISDCTYNRFSYLFCSIHINRKYFFFQYYVVEKRINDFFKAVSDIFVQSCLELFNNASYFDHVPVICEWGIDGWSPSLDWSSVYNILSNIKTYIIHPIYYGLFLW